MWKYEEVNQLLRLTSRNRDACKHPELVLYFLRYLFTARKSRIG